LLSWTRYALGSISFSVTWTSSCGSPNVYFLCPLGVSYEDDGAALFPDWRLVPVVANSSALFFAGLSLTPNNTKKNGHRKPEN
jgi:hypothetical protein